MLFLRENGVKRDFWGRNPKKATEAAGRSVMEGALLLKE